MVEDLSQQTFNSVLQSTSLAELITLWGDFLEHLRNNNGELLVYCMPYTDMVKG